MNSIKIIILKQRIIIPKICNIAVLTSLLKLKSLIFLVTFVLSLSFSALYPKVIKIFIITIKSKPTN